MSHLISSISRKHDNPFFIDKNTYHPKNTRLLRYTVLSRVFVPKHVIFVPETSFLSPFVPETSVLSPKHMTRGQNNLSKKRRTLVIFDRDFSHFCPRSGQMGTKRGQIGDKTKNVRNNDLS